MKLEVGKQYKTREGDRVVVVSGPDKDGYFRVWHEGYDTAWWHSADGLRVPRQYGISFGKCDLVSEWREPRTGEGWINIYDNRGVWWFTSREKADLSAENNNLSEKRIACIHVKWTEGEGLEGGAK